MNNFLLTSKNLEDLFPNAGQRDEFKRRLEELQVKAQPSTSGTSDKGKRRHDDPGPGPNQRQKRRKLERKLKDVKEIMSRVQEKLPNDDGDELIDFLWELMQGLNKDKKELVGVFGKTGAGKSSLINTVIGEEKLLPTGTGRACTSVIIKVEANTENHKYLAEVEFISEEELDDLVWSTKHLFMKKNEVDNESKDNFEMMTALFGINWNNVPFETFMESEKYREMSNAIRHTKHLACDSSCTLSQQLTNFTKNVRKPSGPLYWPVVKCVTIRVPNSDLLRHVTLVDLPGTGDRNKTRNDMWKKMVSSCGTVWIVTDMNRPESEREPWEILRSACSLLGNGGECRNIHFICTKADQCLEELSPEDTKNDIIQEFQALPEVQNHFPQNCFRVFIVSAKEDIMPPEINEISGLDEFLQSLNDPHELVQRYVSDAYGILALMKGARTENTEQKNAVYRSLYSKRDEELKKIKNKMKPAFESLEMILTDGVNNAKQQWESALDETIGSENSYSRLKSILRNNGVQKTLQGQINLNTALSSGLTNTIDRQFREMFPNAGNDGPFFGAIQAFSLNPESLTKANKDVELLLIFLKREEEKLKAGLCEYVREYKKCIYNSLTETVMREMDAGYSDAKRINGAGAVGNMKQSLKDYIRRNEAIFDEAKEEMLKKMQKIMRHIIRDIYLHLKKVMDMSLRKDMTSMPDITQEFADMKKFYNEN